MKRPLLILLAGGFLMGASFAQEPNPERWAKDIARFAKQDAAAKTPAGGVVFTGSSSIAMWSDLPKYFPGTHVLNRGFGGSTLPDVNHYLDRLVSVHRPRAVVLFCGGNDLASGRTPTQVHDDFRTFVNTIHAKQPQTKIFYLSIHLPPGRVKLAEATSRANALIAAECAKEATLTYVDVARLMRGPDGRPNPELYRDPLHPNAAAYQRWAAKLRPLLAAPAP